jgi:hypothetical protein
MEGCLFATLLLVLLIASQPLGVVSVIGEIIVAIGAAIVWGLTIRDWSRSRRA